METINEMNENNIQPIRLLICTPCYNHTCDSRYVQCLLDTQTFFSKLSIDIEISFIGCESLITRGRNIFVSRFLNNPNNTHMLFIDSDITWTPIDILRLLKSNKALCGGVYPFKRYNWERLTEVYDSDDIPHLLNYNVNFDPNNTQVNDSLIKVKHIATGFMMIRRDVFTKLIESYPEKKYTDDCGYFKTEEENKFLYAFFDCQVVNNRYLSEDFYFCHLWEIIGGEVYANMSIKLTHWGSNGYEGNPIVKYNLRVETQTKDT